MGFFSSIFGHNEPSEENKFETLRDDGVRAMQMGELPYAEKCLKAALEIHDDLKTESFLAEVYLRKQDHEHALPLLEKLKNEGDDTLEIELLLAQTQGHLKLYADERKTTADILARQPEEPRALYLAAEADRGLDDNAPAIEHLTQCLTLRPDYTMAQLLRARVFFGMQRFDEALSDVETLLEKNPDDEEYLMLRGKTYLALDRLKEARKDFEEVHSVNPFNQEAVILLGAIYEQTSQWTLALFLYDDAIDLVPDFAAAYKARSGVKRQLKDNLGAEDDMKRVLELSQEKEEKQNDGYTNVENQMNEYYRKMNPFAT